MSLFSRFLNKWTPLITASTSSFILCSSTPIKLTSSTSFSTHAANSMGKISDEYTNNKINDKSIMHIPDPAYRLSGRSLSNDDTMKLLSTWNKDVGIVILSDFEYDDVVAIASLLMNAMINLSDNGTPYLDSIIDNLQIVYFADSKKKDSNGIWKKKLKMAEHFFPNEIYNKIEFRWRHGIENAPKEFKESNLKVFDAKEFTTNMKTNNDIFVLCPGHNALKEIYDNMKKHKPKPKMVNRFVMTVGSFNGKETESSESDMDILFAMSQESIIKTFIDSSRYPWIGRYASGSIHELGNATEMIEMLKSNDEYEIGYQIVMDYLTQFNARLVLNYNYPFYVTLPMNDKHRENTLKLSTELLHHFDNVKYNKLCKIIVSDAYKYGYYKWYDTINEINLDKTYGFDDPKEDWTNLNNWQTQEFQRRSDFLKHSFIFDMALSTVSGKVQDGPAADVVVPFWHFFNNEHNIIRGYMLKNYDGMEHDKQQKWKRINKILGRNNFFGVRVMMRQEDYKKIIMSTDLDQSQTEWRGPIAQIQLKHKLREGNKEDQDKLAQKWKQIYQQFLTFHSVGYRSNSPL